MKFLLTGLVAGLLAIGLPASATSQEPDMLILDGERLPLETNPLAPLIKTKRIALPEPDEQWSSNWRGYVATWKVEDGQLQLDKLEVLLKPEGAPKGADALPVDVLRRVFPSRAKIPADWFSGVLVIPRGELIQYVHMGYGSMHERYTVLRVENGYVSSRSDLSAKEFSLLRKQRFAAYQKTEEYAARLKESRENLSAADAEKFLYEFAVEEYMSVAP